MEDRHSFTLFYQDLSKLALRKKYDVVDIVDRKLWHRIIKVLRLKIGEQFILFDNSYNVQFMLLKETFSGKDKVSVKILSTKQNVMLKPHLILIPCLLKKDAFEDIIYAAAQMGVNEIIPVLSEKTRCWWRGERELKRLFNIMIAACEQSKSFIIPRFCAPVNIKDVVFDIRKDHKKSFKVHFDPTGRKLIGLLQSINDDLARTVILLFGPEGGLTNEEKELLLDSGFESYSLTSTILRSREAIIVGTGGVRSLR